jgi:hypothetical protein
LLRGARKRILAKSNINLKEIEMLKYHVTITWEVEVEAEDKAEAEVKAVELCDFGSCSVQVEEN